MPDDTLSAPLADGPEHYPPWVFALIERIEYEGRKLAYGDAFNPCPLLSGDWANVEKLINAASDAGVDWLAPWSVSPHSSDRSRALVRFKHNDGGESVWKSVPIQDHWSMAPEPTWGDVSFQTLTSIERLYRTVPDIRSSPRGAVPVSESESYLQMDTEGNVEMGLESRDPGSDGVQRGSSVGSDTEAGEDADLRCEPWVYKVLPHLAHGDRQLSAEDASRPFPEPLDWSHIYLFIDAAFKAEVPELLDWFVYPDFDDLSRATVWHRRDDGSGSIWTRVPIGSIAEGYDSQNPLTWGDVIEGTLYGLCDISNPPDEEYFPAPEIPPGETIQDAKKESVESGLFDASYVERALAYRRTHAALSSQMRLSRVSRFLTIGSALAVILLLSAGAVVNAVTWRQTNMQPYNVAGCVLLALLLVVFAFGRRMSTGQPKGEESKSVAELRLEVDLLEERRILEASTGARSAKDRQHSYRESIPQEIDRLRRETRQYRRVHNFFQWGLFVASVAMMVTSAVYEQPQPGKAIMISLGAFVSLTTAVTGYFKYRERAFNLQQTSDAIEQHVTAFDLAIAPYNQKDEAVNLEKLAENVEALRVEQRKRQQQLEQPNQGQQEVI
ncbi:DUF4231 domain-containing protein [Streptomyces sp. NPDC005828]|uniref:DUF4231 domain-containing protein n=1 Tax=Streptomyces sp. NPDC005828 TaxID=3157071 RepID=UPI0033FDF156